MTKHPIKNQRKQSVLMTKASEAGATLGLSRPGGWLVRMENGVPCCMARPQSHGPEHEPHRDHA
jgi:hypothetical protein